MQPDCFISVSISQALRRVTCIDAALKAAFLCQFQPGLREPVRTNETLTAGAAELEQHDDAILAALLRAVIRAFREVGDLTGFNEEPLGDRNLALETESDLVPRMAMARREVALGLLRHHEHVIIGTVLRSFEQPLVRHIRVAALRDQALTPRHLGGMNHIHRLNSSSPPLRAPRFARRSAPEARRSPRDIPCNTARL